MTTRERIDKFLQDAPFAVVGASRARHKYGNKVLRAYLQVGKEVYPVNPRTAEVEGLQTYPNLAALPVKVHGISVITPPEVTEEVVEEAGKLGIKNIWMQPGAESDVAVQRALDLGMNVIADGSCILVVMGYHE